MAYNGEEFSDSFWQIVLVQYFTYFKVLRLRRVVEDVAEEVGLQEFDHWDSRLVLRLCFEFQLVLERCVFLFWLKLSDGKACIMSL